MRAIRLLLIVALLLAVVWYPDTGHAQASPTHTVARGETLSQIAQRYGVPMTDLMALNSIADPDTVYAGQILLLPAPANAPPAEIGIDPAAPADVQPDRHVVRAGESLSVIAQRYGLSLAEIMTLNGIANADAILIGQVLRLTPAVATEPASEAEPLSAADADPGDESGEDAGDDAGQPVAPEPIISLNRTITVGPGDSIAGLALRHGVDEDALRTLNRLAPRTVLTLGQELLLPATRAELEVVAPPAPQAPEQPDNQVVIQPGDSLGRIAERYGIALADLLAANRIANPDTIFIGQTLRIPSPTVEEAEQPAGQLLHTIGRPRSGFYYYTVKRGDTLSALARDFGSTQLAILEYNNLPDPETVYLGLALRIPYGPPPLPLTLPPTPMSGTRFLVSLSRQQCWLLQGDQVRYAWMCSTGYGQWITRTGNFAVQTKMALAKSSAYALDMPYWLGIYDVGPFENGIHGLPVKWETGEKIWEGLIGQPATFGCAMLDDEDAARLFDVAFLGMPVHIVP